MMLKARGGMTLIEVLVSISIASVVALIGYGSFSALADQAERVKRDLPDQQAALVRRTVIDWLRSAVLLPGADASAFRGLDDPRPEYPADEINFVTMAPTALGTRPTRVRLYIDADTSTPERGLVAHLAPWGNDGGQTIVLDSLVQGLDARYRSRFLTDEQWLPSFVSSTVLPDVVELHFGVQDRRSALIARPLLVRIGTGG